MTQIIRSEDGSVTYRVLYGDRDADFADFLSDRLERENERLAVETTDSLEEVLGATDGSVDVIVLGSPIERTDPVSVLQSIRERAADLPVVLFTASGSESIASDAISAGVTDYIVRAAGVEQYQVLATRVASIAKGYRAERKATEATEQLEQLHERIDDAIYAVDEEWRVTYWNDRMVERTGVPAEEIVDEVVWDVFPGMVDTEVYERYHEAMETQEPVTFETYVEPLEYWTDVRVYPDDSGIAIFSREITERKRLERKLERSRKQLRQIIDLLPQLVFAKNESGEYLFANEALAEAYGATVEEIEGATDEELVTSEAKARQFRADDQAVIESGEPKHIPQETLTYPNGKTHVLETKKIPFDPVEYDGQAVLGVASDITRLKETERELKRFEKAVESADHAIFMTDTDGTIEYVNPAFEELTGYASSEVIGQTPRILQSEETSEEYHERLWDTILSGETWHEEVKDSRKSGESYYTDQTITPIEDDTGDIEAFVAIQQDITERKQLETRLRALHEADRALTVADSVEGIASIAIDAAVDVLDLPISCVWQYEDGALVPVAASEDARAVLGSSPTFEPGSSVAWDVYEQGEMRVYSDIRKAEAVYDESTPLRSEMIVPLGEYGVMSVSSTTADAFDDIDVDLFQVLARSVEAAMTQTDRERKLREREQELARHNERLDEFTSVVAHDLRNPLSIAVGMLDVARETHDETHFRKADEALVRMEELIDDLLTVAKQGRSVEETSTVSLGTIARESWQYVDTREATLAVEAGPDETVEADTDRLAQLLENLFRNAIEHGGEDVTVRVGRFEDGFYVEDTGEGIPPDQRDTVFEYGYTTADEGTGFGLSIVADIARAHGWEPSVTEGEDGGARFEFVWPNNWDSADSGSG